MILDGDLQRDWKPGETAGIQDRVHRPRPRPGGDPQGLRGLRGVSGRFIPAFARRSITSLTAVRHGPRGRRACHGGRFHGAHCPPALGGRRVLLVAGDGEERAFAGASGRGHSRRGQDGAGPSPAATMAGSCAPGRMAMTDIADEKGRWIDALALAPGGAMAWSTGKRVTARDDKGRLRQWERSQHRAGAVLRAEGLPAGGEPLQRRQPLVSQYRDRAGRAAVEGLAHRRDLVAGRPLRDLLDAGEHPAWLAAPGEGRHAHVRLSLQDALAFMVA